ncbi:MAG: tRNA (guanosine(46)-N7)-methyltransferase TrmB [Candidatus Competibacteraceae bacterium]
MSIPDQLSQQHIRSFVRRTSRLTRAQQRALTELWNRFGIEENTALLVPEVLFGRQAPLILEIGFGDGESLAAMAQVNPQVDYLGIEVHRPGVGHLLLRAEALSLSNLRVLCADAVGVLEKQLPDGCLERIQIFFPDPWPKARHHKRRLIQPLFAALLARKLKLTGQLHIATDWKDYADHILNTLSAVHELVNTATTGGFVPRPKHRLLTKFEERGQRLGHGVWDMVFERRL